MKRRNEEIFIIEQECSNLAIELSECTGVLTPTTGAFVHNAGSCFVVLIAALL